MGAWGFDPWDSDEAADWFGEFMKHVDIDFIIQTVEEVENNEYDYDRIRAVSYIVEMLGKSYIWPVDYYENLDKMVEKLINLLTLMIEPDSDFLDMWGNNPEIKIAVQKQIDALKKRQQGK
ncbi:DUF4259 domain-containing protein [Listeria sp. FSL L7-0233]|uniref:DUF4259 domain-containing protein n=1 Tax=Listeria cossartiae TaxID=2838249 RepID=UPI0016280D47|nr:DUF4259 domain-containing protein [Listeria cossartiae]MBC1544133.1 DUF4259 domain-containing protein [Listeria cossartiae subsp. cossartiae]MBC1545526.1 DUF4259 domain-containing protein [Listeria cossartiae subsp. cossartiae]MBC2181780.1 DUF4259 domain-containing protein [Listeria cossartiae subsp. cossartiae]MBC2192653.1 DUF4259 domain-containing protein [Listeria cossartiae subsp. cossartiae]